MRRFRRPLAVLLFVLIPTTTFAGPRLADAVRADDVAAARAALAAGSDPDAPSSLMTPLALAAVRGNAAMVRALLDGGADPDAPSLLGANALSMAVRSCRADEGIVRTLIEAGADLENRSGDGITPLMLAVQEKRIDIAFVLLAAGADVNTLNPFGEGVLNYAIYVKNPSLINAALERGVDTAQLGKLFTTVDYDPPGIDDAPSHHEVLCGR